MKRQASYKADMLLASASGEQVPRAHETGFIKSVTGPFSPATALQVASDTDINTNTNADTEY